MSREVRTPAVECTRERLLGCAAGLFASEGYGGVSMRQIACGAGVSKAAIYHYFESKHELYLSLFLHEMEKLAEELEGIAGGAGAPRERLWDFLGCYAAHLCRHVTVMRIIMREAPGTGERLHRVLPATFEKLNATLAMLLREAGVREDADVVASAMFGVVNSLGLHAGEHFGFTEPRIVDFTKNLFEKGVLA